MTRQQWEAREAQRTKVREITVAFKGARRGWWVDVEWKRGHPVMRIRQRARARMAVA